MVVIRAFRRNDLDDLYRICLGDRCGRGCHHLSGSEAGRAVHVVIRGAEPAECVRR